MPNLYTFPLAPCVLHGRAAIGFKMEQLVVPSDEVNRDPIWKSLVHQIPSTDLAALSKLNALIEAATQAALDAGCDAIQSALGVTDGGVAGMYFSGGTEDEVREHLRNYMLSELRHLGSAPKL